MPPNDNGSASLQGDAMARCREAKVLTLFTTGHLQKGGVEGGGGAGGERKEE